MKKNLIKIPILFFLISIFQNNSFADYSEKQRYIKNNMSYQEVLSVLGAPLEKKEFEVLRENLWIYKGFTIKFKNGLTVVQATPIQKKLNKTEQTTPQNNKKELNIEYNWGALEPINNNISLYDILSDKSFSLPTTTTAEKEKKP